MTDDLKRNDPQVALALLSSRNYGEEGIPMILMLENGPSLVAGVDPTSACLRPLLREGAKTYGTHKSELSAVDLSRLIEWIADRTFGPNALAQVTDEARDA
jgi:hypothetical protein